MPLLNLQRRKKDERCQKTMMLRGCKERRKLPDNDFSFSLADSHVILVILERGAEEPKEQLLQ